MKNLVTDKWWQWRIGQIIKKTKTRIVVKWLDGEIWKYDRAHSKFLINIIQK